MRFRSWLPVAVVSSTVVAAACGTDAPTGPAGPDQLSSAVDYQAVIDQFASQYRTTVGDVPDVQGVVSGIDKDGVGGGGPVLAPGDPPLTNIYFLYGATMWLYQEGYLAADRALAILYPVVFSAERLQAGDDDLAISGLESAVAWIQQRTDQGLIPADIGAYLVASGNDAIGQLGGPNTTRTLCLSSDERSCVTGNLTSIFWNRPILATELWHDFSYSFLDGDPAEIEMTYNLYTTGFCAGGPPLGTPGQDTRSVTVRLDPDQTANPFNGTETLVHCDVDGIIRGFQWDGITVRDAGGNVTASCSLSAGDPCWEKAPALVAGRGQ